MHRHIQHIVNHAELRVDGVDHLFVRLVEFQRENRLVGAHANIDACKFTGAVGVWEQFTVAENYSNE